MRECEKLVFNVCFLVFEVKTRFQKNLRKAFILGHKFRFLSAMHPE